MQKITFLLFAIASFSLSQAQIVNIPDARFKAGLLNYNPSIDTNNDDEIQVAEALAVTVLDFNNPSNTFPNNLDSNVDDLTGLEAFTNLTTLTLRSLSHITSFDLSSLTNLQHLDCSNNYNLDSLNVGVLLNLQTLNCSYNSDLTSINLTGLSNLTTFNSAHCLRVNSIITTGANNIINFDCSSNALHSLDISAMTHLQTLNCAFQQDMPINPSGAISSLDLTALTSLTSLNCSSNNITTLNISHLTNLTYLNCSYNDIATLDVAPLTNLTSLYCASNQLQSLDLTPLIHLTNLDCHGNQLPDLNLNTLASLVSIDCGQNSIASLNVSNNTALTFLACAGNQLTTLNISNLVNLKDLICSSNQLTTIDVSNLHHLTRIEVGYNQFETLDFSQSIIPDPFGYSYVNYSVSGNPNLTYVNVKNGINMNYGSFMANQCPNLHYICADENSIQSIMHDLQMYIMDYVPNIQVNSYCTFVPGGIHNTITGTVTLDNNNNGCDTNDIHPNNFKISINDGLLTGATFSNTDGSYSFFTQSGSFILTPQFENSYFTISPTTATINFANLDESTQTQNFCVTANGIHNDVEVTLFPSGNARPGFDANYLIVYKNKGNQVLSGNINLVFDDGIFDFVSANPALDNQSTNNLVWNYSNLLPFESRIIHFKLNLNGPMETPPVNIDDILNFTATINPVSGDETIDDNTFNLVQHVNGSFDPNDKTCLEGNFITPEMVGDYLHYVIRFQNSGTAAAENIVVKDVIDTAKFDISTLQLTSTSHPQVTRVNGNRVEFVFEGINLPAEIDNEPASHGYVAFKIKTKNNLVLGNTVSNTANIYFDYNFPVVTNTASTTVSSLGSHNVENTTVSISPNPVKNILSISAKDTITSIQLFDVQGRLIATKMNASILANLDLTQQHTGIYFVKVYTENGVKTQKIIKE